MRDVSCTWSLEVIRTRHEIACLKMRGAWGRGGGVAYLIRPHIGYHRAHDDFIPYLKETTFVLSKGVSTGGAETPRGQGIIVVRLRQGANLGIILL